MTKSKKSEVTKKIIVNEVKGPNETPNVPNVGDKMHHRTSPDDSARID